MISPQKVCLELKNVSKTFYHKEIPSLIIDNLSLEVYEGEFLSIFGPNGCGKSTLLHLIAGILPRDDGTIAITTQDQLSPPVGIVFQNYEKSLMPWLSCIDNITFSLEEHHDLSAKLRKEQGRELLDRLGITLPLDHYPYQLSGGQKQLTCIARALITKPTLLLLDEPFASLDFQTRLYMQETIQHIWDAVQITTIFVSHELDEAIYLADRLVLLTRKPARIVKSFPITLPHPRDINTQSTKPFLALRREILSTFRGMLVNEI